MSGTITQMHSIQMLLVYLGLVPKIIPLSWLGENCFKVLGQVPIKTKVIFEADFVPMLWDFDCDFISVQSGKLINNHDTYFEDLLNKLMLENGAHGYSL